MTSSVDSESFDKAAAELAELPALRELATELRHYPVRLLQLVCDEHDRRGAPVPDHSLRLLPYLGETALRGLIEGRYVDRIDDASFAIAAFVPTDKARALLKRLAAKPRKR
jgi:hypothetical protein